MKRAAASKKRARPPVNRKWHPTAQKWYLSLADSGQSKFYEPSDWALAVVLAEQLSRELKPQPIFNPMTGELVMEVERPMKGASLAAILKGMTSLLVSESDRRRLQIELDLLPSAVGGDGEKPAPVTDIRSWREGLNA